MRNIPCKPCLGKTGFSIRREILYGSAMGLTLGTKNSLAYWYSIVAEHLNYYYYYYKNIDSEFLKVGLISNSVKPHFSF